MAIEQAQSLIQQLSISHLEDLAEALLDFAKLANLTGWLQEHSG